MRAKKPIFVVSLICLLMLIVLAGFYLVIDTTKVPKAAESYEELQIQVELDRHSEYIKIWQGADGVYYFFLPSWCNVVDLRFANIGKSDTLVIKDYENQTEYSAEVLCGENIQLKHTYEMKLMFEGGHSLEPTLLQFVKSAELATVFIETESGSLEAIHTSKEAEEKAKLILIDEEGNMNYQQELQYIRTRGNSTFADFEKKAYQLKLYKDASLLGMPQGEKWILLANAIDDSLIRNALVYEFADKHTSVPSVKGKFVDVYINGTYEGNYYLCEKIEIDKNRLNITDLESLNYVENDEANIEHAVPYLSEDGRIRAFAGIKNPHDITGGYLLESIPGAMFESVESGFCTQNGSYFEVISPKYATVDQVNYICNLFNEFEIAIASEGGINPDTGKHYTEYIDLDSWIEKYLIDEVFHDPDSVVASLYFYKDSDRVNSHIFAGPVWDYDRAIGSYGVDVYELDDPLKVGDFGIYVPDIVRKYRESKELLEEKFRSIFVKYIESDLTADLNYYREILESSYEMNAIRWPQKYGYYTELESNFEYIKWFLNTKKTTLTERWMEEVQYHTVTFLDADNNIFKSYEVKHGEVLEVVVPNAVSYGALFAGWVNSATGTKYDARVPVMENMEYKSEWLDWNLLLLNGLEISGVDLSTVDADQIEHLAEIIREKQSDLKE